MIRVVVVLFVTFLVLLVLSFSLLSYSGGVYIVVVGVAVVSGVVVSCGVTGVVYGLRVYVAGGCCNKDTNTSSDRSIRDSGNNISSNNMCTRVEHEVYVTITVTTPTCPTP